MSWFLRRRRKMTATQSRALKLPPISRGQQFGAMLGVFIVGVVLTLFVVHDPFDLGLLGDKDGTPAGESATAAQTTETQTAEIDVLYQCPMHLEVIEETQGNCPICSMKLSPMKESVSTSETDRTEDGERGIPKRHST